MTPASADHRELPPFWQEIWRASALLSYDPAYQSTFNDGAHFVINALKAAAKELVRLRKIDDAHDGPWEDEEAWHQFNSAVTFAYVRTVERFREIIGDETVDATWPTPYCNHNEDRAP